MAEEYIAGENIENGVAVFIDENTKLNKTQLMKAMGVSGWGGNVDEGIIDSYLSRVMYGQEDIKKANDGVVEKLINRGICPVCGVGLLKIGNNYDKIGCDCGFLITKETMREKNYEGMHVKDVISKEAKIYIKKRDFTLPDGKVAECPKCKTYEHLSKSKNGSIICSKCLEVVVDNSKRE